MLFRSRAMYQMKEQEKTPEKQLNEVEIGNLPEKELKNKHLEELKNKQTEMNNTITEMKNTLKGGFPGGTVVENLPANAGDTGSSPGLGRSHMPRSN